MSYTLFGSAFKLPPNISYRGEGNSSIVVSLPDTHEILRLHKKFKPRSLFGWIVTFLKKFFIWNVKYEVDRETQNLKFYLHVMRALLGRQFVGTARQVYLSRRQVKELNEYLVNLRPAHRKEKYIQSGRATIFEDYAFLPKHISLKFTHTTYAVEIKPKQGFIPHLQQKLDKCTYCLNQYLKLQNGQIDRISHYCPFDLFSGIKDRMYKAISALVEDPQNNLRIFHNGLLVYGENKPLTVFHEVMENWLQMKADLDVLLHKFCELLSMALLTDFPLFDQNHDCADLTFFCEVQTTISSCTEVTGENLPKNCVLKQIFSMQQLDLMGPQEYSKMVDSSNLDLWKYIDYLLEEIDKNSNKCARCTVGGIIKNYRGGVEMDERDRCLFFVPYLLACVARDCSIMLSFSRVEKEDDLSIGAMFDDVQIITLDSAKYVIKVGVLDLYPKPMSSILKHCKRADAVCEAYRSVVQS